MPPPSETFHHPLYRNSAHKTTVLLLLLDVLAVLLCFNVALYARSLWHGVVIDPLWVPVIVGIVAIHLVDGYKTRTDMMSLDYTSQHAIALFAALIFTLLLTFVVVPAGYELQSSRAVVLVAYLLLIPVTLSYRRVAFARALHARGVRPIIFAGTPPSRAAFQKECEHMGMAQPIIFAATDAPTGGTPPAGTTPADAAIPPVRSFEDILDDIDGGRLAVEAIVLRETNRDLPESIAPRLMRLYFSGVPTYTLELFHQVYWRKIPLYRLNQTWLFQEGFPIAREPVFERVKRTTDLFLAFVTLLLTWPFILLAALAIRLEGTGPVFFTQMRVGKNRVKFRAWKLRTMRVNQPATAASLYTQPGDKRITRVGAFLRLTRIDELPQVWNVLKGDMSFIGPRAEWDKLVERYEREIPCYHFRHLVKPGITGWAQINYPYGAGIEDTLRKLEYDLYYIRHYSFTLDASIVLKTIHTMLFGKGR